jgi:spoIIIJ-associated protein
LRTDDDTDIRILVDVDNYRERVIEPLKEKAIRLAKSVKESGKPAKLPPMATVVRREIHIAAKSISGISTVSHGEGQVKTLTILSDRKAPRQNTKREDGGKRRSGGGRGRYPRDEKRD